MKKADQPERESNPMESEQRIIVNEHILRSACDLAATTILKGKPDICDLWLRPLADAQEELIQAGSFTVTDRGNVFVVSEITQQGMNIYANGQHANCSSYSKGLHCRHLAISHIIKLYLAALELPALAVPQVRDVFAHRPAIEQAPARREGFNLQQAMGGDW